MGKRYYCDYCDKTMVATPSILRTHNNGLVHQKFVQEHYQQYKDPETILSEEAHKKPCLRFASGSCQFGALCRYSHYTQEELNALRQFVANKTAARTEIPDQSFEELYEGLQRRKSKQCQDQTTLYDSSGVIHTFPWTYNEAFDRPDLPPSLKRMEVGDFDNASIREWGLNL